MMIFRNIFIVSTLFLGILIVRSTEAMAQIDPVETTGLSAALSKVHVNQREISLQFIVTNNTRSRVYVRDALGEQSQRAFLGSGEQLQPPRIIGVEVCSNNVSSCAMPPTSNDLHLYSYIEPGKFVALSLIYSAQTPVNENDTVSFSLVLMARFANPNGDPLQVGPVNPVRFSFPYVSLLHH